MHVNAITSQATLHLESALRKVQLGVSSDTRQVYELQETPPGHAADPALPAGIAYDMILKLLWQANGDQSPLVEADTGLQQLYTKLEEFAALQLEAGLDACGATHALQGPERRAKAVYASGAVVCYARATSQETHGTDPAPLYDVGDGVHPRSLACYAALPTSKLSRLRGMRKSIEHQVK